MRKAITVVTVVVALTSLAYIVSSLGGRREDPRFVPQDRIRLDERPSEPAPSTSAHPDREVPREGSVLRVAIAPVISPEKSLQIYRDLIEYLAEKAGRKPVVLQRRSYADINELVRYRRCDVALICTYPFLRGRRDFGMTALVVPVIGGEITYRSLIIVPQSSQAESLLDLAGHRFASADIMSNTGWIYPATWLLAHGENPDRFFSDNVVTGSHDKSVLAVSSGYVDGAAVDSLVYEQMKAQEPELVSRTRVVQRSEPFGIPPFAVHPKIDPALAQSLRSILLAMHEEDYGGRILDFLGIDRFVIPPENLYDTALARALAWEGRP